MINEVQPNPGGANAACPTCGALLSCLSCGNDLRAKEAELTRVLADLDRVSKERLASANALDDARRGIAWLKREIAEDAKATAESQEITGKYMADAEAAQREIELLKKIIGAFSRLRIGKYVSWGNAGGPNECEHGRADGIPCPTCDAEIVSAATGGQG